MNRSPTKLGRYRMFSLKVWQNGVIIDDIRRAVSKQQSGKFWLIGSTDENGNKPLVVQYQKKLYAVKSQCGDLNNPETRTDDYLDYLYIELPDATICCRCKGKFKPEELTGGQYLICAACNDRRR